MSALDQDPHAAAAELGLRVRLPADDELFVDIDSDEAFNTMVAMRDVLRESGFGLTLRWITDSKSGYPHQHVCLVAWRALTPLERVALQACLGSDRKRELLSFLRIEEKTDRPPTVFFEKA